MNAASRSRVLVWLDPTAPQEASLEVLAGLGSASEILGLFVEDSTLLNLSRLAVAREVTFEETTAQQLDQRRIEQQFRVHGARMRNLFETAARKLSVSHSFRVARGELCTELLSVSAGFDMLVLAHSRHHFGTRLNVRAQLAKLLSGGPRTLVFVQEQWRTGQRVVALFDGSPASEAALRAGAAIAGSEGMELSVLLPNVADELHLQLRDQATEVLGDHVIHSFRNLGEDDTDELVRAANAEHARVLVVPGAEPTDTEQLVTELLDRVSCSLIVAR